MQSGVNCNEKRQNSFFQMKQQAACFKKHAEFTISNNMLIKQVGIDGKHDRVESRIKRHQDQKQVNYF